MKHSCCNRTGKECRSTTTRIHYNDFFCVLGPLTSPNKFLSDSIPLCMPFLVQTQIRQQSSKKYIGSVVSGPDWHSILELSTMFWNSSSLHVVEQVCTSTQQTTLRVSWALQSVRDLSIKKKVYESREKGRKRWADEEGGKIAYLAFHPFALKRSQQKWREDLLKVGCIMSVNTVSDTEAFATQHRFWKVLRKFFEIFCFS